MNKHYNNIMDPLLNTLEIINLTQNGQYTKWRQQCIKDVDRVVENILNLHVYARISETLFHDPYEWMIRPMTDSITEAIRELQLENL